MARSLSALRVVCASTMAIVFPAPPVRSAAWPAGALVVRDLDQVEPRVGQLRPTPAQLQQPAVEVEHVRVRVVGQLGPVQLGAHERRRVLRVGYVVGGPAVLCELAAGRPRRGGQLRLGCEVKNCHGVDAPHSSPMNSIGVNGSDSSRAAPAAQQPGLDEPGESVAQRAVAHLVVRLQGGDERGRHGTGPVIGTGRPWDRPRKEDHVPSCRKPRVSTCPSASPWSKSA